MTSTATLGPQSAGAIFQVSADAWRTVNQIAFMVLNYPRPAQPAKRLTVYNLIDVCQTWTDTTFPAFLAQVRNTATLSQGVSSTFHGLTTTSGFQQAVSNFKQQVKAQSDAFATLGEDIQTYTDALVAAAQQQSAPLSPSLWGAYGTPFTAIADQILPDATSIQQASGDVATNWASVVVNIGEVYSQIQDISTVSGILEVLNMPHVISQWQQVQDSASSFVSSDIPGHLNGHWGLPTTIEVAGSDTHPSYDWPSVYIGINVNNFYTAVDGNGPGLMVLTVDPSTVSGGGNVVTAQLKKSSATPDDSFPKFSVKPMGDGMFTIETTELDKVGLATPENMPAKANLAVDSDGKTIILHVSGMYQAGNDFWQIPNTSNMNTLYKTSPPLGVYYNWSLNPLGSNSISCVQPPRDAIPSSYSDSYTLPLQVVQHPSQYYQTEPLVGGWAIVSDKFGWS